MPSPELPRFRFLLQQQELDRFRATVRAENAERRRESPTSLPAAFVGPPQATTFEGVIGEPLYWQTVRVADDLAGAWLSLRWEWARLQPPGERTATQHLDYAPQ